MVCALGVSSVPAESIMFNYQGRVKVQGQPFDGTGQFKFAIVSASGNLTYWSNDGTSLGGNPPAAYVDLTVTEGVFSAMIGDPTLGMEVINSAIFNNPGPLKLRVWFSDGSHGFQQLVPDHRIANPELIGVISGDVDFTIYVDDATGDDANSGLAPNKAKKTIQAAVDILPERLRANVTIDIADGVYREQVSIFGITVAPGKMLYLVGDDTWTPASGGDPSVRVTGTDDDGTPVAVRDNGFVLQNASRVEIQGIHVDYTTRMGIQILEGSAILRRCKADHCGIAGFDFRSNSTGSCYSCLAEYAGSWGFVSVSSSTVTLHDCIGRNNQIGVTANTNSGLNFKSTGEFANNTETGIHVTHLARAVFDSAYVGSVHDNALYGVDIRYNSYTEADNRNTYSNNGTGPIDDVHLQWGGAQYY